MDPRSETCSRYLTSIPLYSSNIKSSLGSASSLECVLVRNSSWLDKISITKCRSSHYYATGQQGWALSHFDWKYDPWIDLTSTFGDISCKFPSVNTYPSVTKCLKALVKLPKLPLTYETFLNVWSMENQLCVFKKMLRVMLIVYQDEYILKRLVSWNDYPYGMTRIQQLCLLCCIFKFYQIDWVWLFNQYLLRIHCQLHNISFLLWG